MRELARHFFDGRDLDADGGIGVEAVFLCGEIEFDEIAGLNDAVARNAVHHFVVYADADVAGESIDHWR